jgi:hypothetical protein
VWFLRSKSALRVQSVLRGSAVLFFVLIGKWLQPSGFTQNVQRTQRIVSGQDMILQSLGVITSHSPHDNALDRPVGEEEPRLSWPGLCGRSGTSVISPIPPKWPDPRPPSLSV